MAIPGVSEPSSAALAEFVVVVVVTSRKRVRARAWGTNWERRMLVGLRWSTGREIEDVYSIMGVRWSF
jgi:hypothetical protein